MSAARQFFPCVLNGPDGDGWFCVIVPGPNVNAQGRSETEALTEAAVILQEVIDDAARDGEPTPMPGDAEAWREPGDRISVIQAVRVRETA